MAWKYTELATFYWFPITMHTSSMNTLISMIVLYLTNFIATKYDFSQKGEGGQPIYENLWKGWKAVGQFLIFGWKGEREGLDPSISGWHHMWTVLVVVFDRKLKYAVIWNVVAFHLYPQPLRTEKKLELAKFWRKKLSPDELSWAWWNQASSKLGLAYGSSHIWLNMIKLTYSRVIGCINLFLTSYQSNY